MGRNPHNDTKLGLCILNLVKPVQMINHEHKKRNLVIEKFFSYKSKLVMNLKYSTIIQTNMFSW